MIKPSPALIEAWTSRAEVAARFEAPAITDPVMYPERYLSDYNKAEPMMALLDMYRCYPCMHAFMPQQWVHGLIHGPSPPVLKSPAQARNVCNLSALVAKEV